MTSTDPGRPRRSRRLRRLACCLAAAALHPALAHAAPDTAGVPPHRYVTDQRARIAGTLVRYRSAVEEHVVRDADGKPEASIYTITYARTNVPDAGRRPVVFAFNGGPGSASIWLHLGFLGPRRLASSDALTPATTPPFSLVDNADSPLDVADIVLIDPVGTGLSRLAAGAPADRYLSADGDARATARVIEDWLRAHGRANAPRYLLSESYGTIRAILVAKLLAGGPTATGEMTGLNLNGLILLGPALSLPRDPDGDITLANALPSMAATACQFGKAARPCTPEGAAEDARRFARGDYIAALYQGIDLAPGALAQAASRMSAIVGIDPATLAARRLRVPLADFARLLLADRGLATGMYDARYVATLAPAGPDPVADDPAMGRYVPGFIGAMSDYLAQLGVPPGADYRAIAFADVNRKWDYGNGPGVPPDRNYAVDLAIVRHRNPSLRILIANGLYDLVTPMGQVEYDLAHAGIKASDVDLRYYPSGHMSYLGESSRRQLARDVREMIAGR